MSDDSFIPPENDVWKRKRRSVPESDPIWVTYGFFLACMVMFILNMMRKSAAGTEEFDIFGWRSAYEVWGGDWWALISTVFVHLEIFHVAFNLYWLWILGVVLERTIGAWRYFFFFLIAGFVSSAMQMWLGGGVGIGASGALYGIFGFMWIARYEVREFGEILGLRPWHILLIWLFICLPLDWSGVMSIGNFAHFSGMAVGILCGAIYRLPKYRVAAMAGCGMVVLATVISLFWAPWSVPWLALKANTAIDEGDLETAEKYISKLVKRGDFVPQELKELIANPLKEE